MRFLTFALTALAIFVGTRGLVRVLPGDPLETLVAESGTSIPEQELRHDLGLDRAFFPAVWEDLRRASRGDLGRSLHSRQPVAPEILTRLGRTALLALLALALALLLAVPLGTWAAAARGGKLDRLCSVFGAITAALPAAWIGPLLLYFFAVLFPILPVGGHVLLPALTLALGFSGLWCRLIRSRVRDSLFSGAAPGARARGLTEARVLLKYGLAPVSGPLFAYLGTQAGNLLAGSLITEVVFSWPGLGTYLMEAVLKRDYPVVEAATFVTATISLLGTRFGDALQRLLDPRLSR